LKISKETLIYSNEGGKAASHFPGRGMISLRSQLIFQMVTTEEVRGKSFPPAGFGAELQLISVSLIRSARICLQILAVRLP
jgi:hypothetical protein